jgi:hypothetical protein
VYERYLCSGALVAPTVVITAAHCLYQETGLQPPSWFAVVVGRTRLSSSEGAEIPLAGYRFLTDQHGAELFDYGSRRFDVVLLSLTSPAPGPPIKIAGADERWLWTPGRIAYLTGWGQLGPNDPFADDMRVVRLPIVSDTTCRDGWYHGEFLTDVMLCAGGQGRSACHGDSGGPLAAPTASGGFRLVGLASWGTNPCGGAPSVYTRIADGLMRSALQMAGQQAAGIDIAGSGSYPPGRCIVPRLGGKRLGDVKRELRAHYCRLGQVTQRQNRGRAGRVLSQRPRCGTSLQSGWSVSVVVGRR